jgi:hypothetical protein
MALDDDESAMTDLLGALRAGGGMDVVREALALVLQALAAGPADACQRCSGHQGRASPEGRPGAVAACLSIVVLAGRATRVP